MKRTLVDALWRLGVRFERQLRWSRRVVAALLDAASRGMRNLPQTSWQFGPPRRLTLSTRDWAGRHAVACIDLDPPWTTDRASVEARGQAVPHQFTDSRRWPMPGTFVLVLDDARLWGDGATPVSSDDTVLVDQSNAFGIEPTRLPIMRRLSLGRPTRVTGVSATIAAAYSQSYYHWMFDVLPRVDLLRRSGVAFDRLLTPDVLAFQRETLELAGVPTEQRRSLAGGGEYLHLDKLVFPSVPGTPGQSPPAVCSYLRSLLAGAIADQPVRRRLYLTRADTNRRKLANEKEVMAALAPFGFEWVRMGGRTVAEQAQLFAQAEAVIAPHGGALTNLVFCSPGTKVVELFPPGYTPVCFWLIADAVGLDYRPIFDDTVGPHDGTAQWVPYRVAPSRVLDTLADLSLQQRINGL